MYIIRSVYLLIRRHLSILKSTYEYYLQYFDFRLARGQLNQRSIIMYKDQNGESQEINLSKNCKVFNYFFLCDTYDLMCRIHMLFV